MTRPYDAFLFGGGLAGCILYQRLTQAGLSCLLIDDPAKSSCSRVAAGLINPIAGKRFKVVWQAPVFIPEAIEFYQSQEAAAGKLFFRPMTIARLFANAEEKASWEKQAAQPETQRWVAPLDSARLPPSFAGETEGFSIQNCGCLDTVALIDFLRGRAAENGCLVQESFRYDELDIAQGETLRWRGFAARRAIFCEGHLATANPWFSYVPFNPAKGVIGTIDLIPTLHPAPTAAHTAVIKGKFLIPQADGSYRVGATYRWHEANDTPDAASIQELEDFLQRHLGEGWRWREVKAGVRPTVGGGYPVVGPHPDDPRLIAFNGFGSKGSLQIPAMARRLGAFILRQEPLLPEALPSRFAKAPQPQNKRWIATEIVRSRVQAALKPGDAAIDATLGNGLDAAWLCEGVGANGSVFAFDIQTSAIDSARRRLRSAGLLERATLIQAGHEAMADHIPNALRGTLAAIVFNLGYLPGGDPSLTTRTSTTLPALAISAELLRPGGLLAATLYPGHPGGEAEAEAVLSWTRSLDPQRFTVEVVAHPRGIAHSPFPVFVRAAESGPPDS